MRVFLFRILPVGLADLLRTYYFLALFGSTANRQNVACIQSKKQS